MVPPRNMSHHDSYPDALLRRILGSVKIIAMVGASPDWHKASSFAMKYLQSKGYRVIPVNPRAAGQKILGETCYASLQDIPLNETGPIDMVDVFRRSSAAGPIADDAIAIGAKILWMQLGVRNDEAAAKAEDAGLTVIMNRCPKIEYGRLQGELSWGGFNSRIITSKRKRTLG
jgi:predicted CoA-binding protein